MEMSPVTHFELPADNKSRMRKFYEKAFGWKTHQLGKEMGGYVIATTTETDENRMVTKPGTINGGFFQRTDDPISRYPSIVVQVEDVHESIRRVKEAGGKISGEVEEIPGVGLRVSVIDSEGNRISVMQPLRK